MAYVKREFKRCRADNQFQLHILHGVSNVKMSEDKNGGKDLSPSPDALIKGSDFRLSSWLDDNVPSEARLEPEDGSKLSRSTDSILKGSDYRLPSWLDLSTCE